jgi:hypothetical protein
MGDDFMPGSCGPMNTMGMVTTRDAAVKPEAWIGPERGNVEVKHGNVDMKREDVHMRAARCIVPLSFRPLLTADRWGVARRASRLLVSPKIPVATHPISMLHHHPSTTTIRPVKIPPIQSATT